MSNEEFKRCSRCGQPVTANFRFCQGCGAPVEAPAHQTPNMNQAMPNMQYQNCQTQGMVNEPKDRLVFILLGVFLGCFGAHNFYAGYTGKAVAQLLITLLSFTTLAFISVIWAIIEVITVRQDAKGVPFVMK